MHVSFRSKTLVVKMLHWITSTINNTRDHHMFCTWMSQQMSASRCQHHDVSITMSASQCQCHNISATISASQSHRPLDYLAGTLTLFFGTKGGTCRSPSNDSKCSVLISDFSTLTFIVLANRKAALLIKSMWLKNNTIIDENKNTGLVSDADVVSSDKQAHRMSHTVNISDVCINTKQHNCHFNNLLRQLRIKLYWVRGSPWQLPKRV